MTRNPARPLFRQSSHWLLLCVGPTFLAAAAPPKVDSPVRQGLAAWRGQPRDSVGEWAIAGGVKLHSGDPHRLSATSGKGVLYNGEHGRTVNLLTRKEYADVEAHIEFAVAKGQNSGVYFMGRYEIQIHDSWDAAKDRPRERPGFGGCGGIYQRWNPKRGRGKEGFEGHPPRVNACRRPGEWQTLDVVFRAPRFDAAGKKTAKARFVRVLHNGVLIHENVELGGPTRAAAFPRDDERPTGPLMFQGDHGAVAFREIRLRAVAEAESLARDFPREVLDDSGFVAILDGKTLDGWHVSARTGHSRASGNKSGGRWVVEDGAIVGSQDIPGNGGIVVTDRQYGDFEVVLEMRNDYGPDSGLFLRSSEDGRAYQYLIDYHGGGNLAGLYGEGLSPGFHLRNFTFLGEPAKIQAVEGPYPLPVKPEEWPRFWKHGEWNELRARITGNPPTITTWINSVRFVEWTDDRKRAPDRGAIALQVHGGGDLTKQFVRYRKIRVRELGR
ncbi:MAG: DUF1080 domain-containing protein [Planctomycetota bacterium]|nr:DUF1080 domain-containing protein [Planctomycetota bacterium]